MRSALVGLALAVATPACGPDADAPAADLAALAEARLPRRIEPHLSIPVVHRPCEPPPSAAGHHVASAICPGGDGDGEARTRAGDIQARARSAARARVDAAAMHADALVDLVWTSDDEAAASRVVSAMEASARLDPTADVLCDLAAAHLVRAGAADRADDLMAALDAALRALEREPRHACARFNAALAESRLGLDRVARDDWDAYLALDPDGPWADEAHRHHAATAVAPPDTFPSQTTDTAALARFAAAHPQQAREAAVEVLLPGWADSLLAGHEGAAEDHRGRAEAVGTGLLRRPGGDRLVADLAAAARGPHRTDVARALSSLKRGMHVVRNGGDTALAAAAFRRAIPAAAAVPPLRDYVAYYDGVRRHRHAVADSGQRTFRALAARVDGVRYPYLAGRARWSLTTIGGRDGKYAEALERAGQAERLFRTAGETGSASFVLAMGSEAAMQLGEFEASARGMLRVLHELRPTPGEAGRHNQLYVAAQAAQTTGHPHAAARLLDDDLAALAGAPAAARVEPLLRRAEARAVLGRRELARADLEEGFALLDSVSDRQAREWYLQDFRTAAVALDERRAPATLARMDSVVDYGQRPGQVTRLLPALVTRARVRLALGDADGAGADLDSVARVLARRGGQMSSVSQRTRMLDARRSVFEQLAVLQARAGRPWDALMALERGRAPLTLDEPREPRRQAPAGTVVVSLSLVGDTLLRWTLSGSSLRMTMDTLPPDAIARLVEAVTAGLEGGVERGGVDETLKDLHRLLMPAAGTVSAGAELVVVADGVLAQVPFAALRRPDRGREVVRDHEVRFAATVADATAPRPRLAAPRGPALVVAPWFDGPRHAALDSLPGADLEARDVVAAYPGATLLAGRGATPSRVRAAMGRAGMVHLAGHAVFDDAHPWRSYLVLAPDASGDVLRAEEIETLDLRGVRLVVLSACRTQRASGRSGGMAGLTAAVMGASADGVIGSLWRVEDAQTRAFMAAFHQAYRASGNPSAALRQAQLTLLASSDPILRSPAAWAGFRYTGR